MDNEAKAQVIVQDYNNITFFYYSDPQVLDLLLATHYLCGRELSSTTAA